MEGRPRGRFLLWAVPRVLFALPGLDVAALGDCVWRYRHGWVFVAVAYVAFCF